MDDDFLDLTRASIVLPQEIVQHVTPQIIAPDHAVRLRARQDLLDKDGTHRATGEEWLVRDIGAYLPGVFEEVGQWVDYGYTSLVPRPLGMRLWVYMYGTRTRL